MLRAEGSQAGDFPAAADASAKTDYAAAVLLDAVPSKNILQQG